MLSILGLKESYINLSESELPDTCSDQPGKDPVFNYMNYSTDDSLLGFTDGQKERMWMMLKDNKPNHYSKWRGNYYHSRTNFNSDIQYQSVYSIKDTVFSRKNDDNNDYSFLRYQILQNPIKRCSFIFNEAFPLVQTTKSKISNTMKQILNFNVNVEFNCEVITYNQNTYATEEDILTKLNDV